METVIILSLVGILLVGCWHVVKYWKQLKTDPEKWFLIEIIVCWVPVLIAIIVSVWLAPILIGYAVAAHVLYWAVEWICFRGFDWYIARANRGNQEQRTDDQTRQAAKGPDLAGTRYRGPQRELNDGHPRIWMNLSSPTDSTGSVK